MRKKTKRIAKEFKKNAKKIKKFAIAIKRKPNRKYKNKIKIDILELKINIAQISKI